ncbi:MAG: biotin-dependent carboxyltransferase [Nitrospiraceae bacterium]|nr:biotin-dependent carboxyltransferase [Nitrospiraceae bacterium]
MATEYATIHILRPGLSTTVQDLGRHGFRRYGVSVSGAMDRWALTVGNRLLGNHDGAAGLEITLQGPELLFDKRSWIAITGGDLSPSCRGQALPMWTVVELPAGARVEFGARRKGARAYLTVAGGIEGPRILGSHSTHTRSRLGGMQGRSLKKWDQLAIGAPPNRIPPPAGRALSLSHRPDYSSTPTLRVLSGPQLDYFTKDSLATLVESGYRITSESDRMGYRLAGPILQFKGQADIVSDAVVCGAIQVPPDGQPILLMADCQTTGGYAKPAVVISVDLPKAGQLLPGDSVGFRWVSAEEASSLLRTTRAELDRLLPPASPE